MRFKNILLGAALLVIAGCGCGDDEILGLIGASAESVNLGPAADVPPCVLPTTPPDERRVVDVFIVIDKSWAMKNTNMGLVPQIDGDTRKRTLVAEELMKNVQSRIMSDLQASYGDADIATTEQRIDIAFGVGFFCDFGGAFAGSANGRNWDAAPVAISDAQARPFTLSMPVIRAKHPLFQQFFDQAILTDTPGDGRVLRTNPNGTIFLDQNDPQSGIEALYQIATGAGFDGDVNGNTNDSGAPCAVTTQTAPGDSGDVPAVVFAATPEETDPDGRPMFHVRDSNNATTTVNVGGNDVTCFASGNLGGVGWRNEAARFVIYVSDIATIGTFSGQVPTDISNTPGTTPTVPNTVGPATGPRGARTLPSAAFMTPVADGRAGDITLPSPIAPTNAHTVPETIAALNNLHIEVLCVGYPNVQPDPVKPNGGNNGGTAPNDIPGTDVPAVGFDQVAPPGDEPNTYEFRSYFPWQHMSALSVLTGSTVDTQDPAGGTLNLPAVYNAGTVWRNGPDPANINDHIRVGLAQRIREWVDTPYLNTVAFGGVAFDDADRPTMTMDFQITLAPSPTFDSNFVELLGNYGATLTTPATLPGVSVPVVVTGETVPAPSRISFPDLSLAILSPTTPAIAETFTDTLTYRVEATNINITPGPSGSQLANSLADQLRRKVGEREVITWTDASLIVTLERTTLNPDSPEVVPDELTIQMVNEGCGSLRVDSVSITPTAAQVPVGAPCNPLNPAP